MTLRWHPAPSVQGRGTRLWWVFRRAGPRLALLGSYQTRREAAAGDRRTAIVVAADSEALARFKAALTPLLWPHDERADDA
jgi:hypothetical protein